MKQSLMEKLETQFKDLQNANLMNTKPRAKALMQTTHEIMIHQARVNAAVQKLLQDGFDHRTELVKQIEDLKDAHADEEVEAESDTTE